MIPVRQTELGESRGNCFAACVASILEVPLQKLPNFCRDYPDDEWEYKTNAWLVENYGLGLMGMRFENETDAKAFLAGVEHIIAGKGPRGALHAVVGIGGKMVFDPYPTEPGHAGIVELDCYYIFVAARPSLNAYKHPGV